MESLSEAYEKEELIRSCDRIFNPHEWQMYDEITSLAGLTFQADPSPVGFHEIAGNSQP